MYFSISWDSNKKNMLGPEIQFGRLVVEGWIHEQHYESDDFLFGFMGQEELRST